jgi:GAF domain-containing protein
MSKQNETDVSKDIALQELYRHSQSLLRLSRALEQAEDYNDVLEATRKEVQQTLGYPTILVFLHSEDGLDSYPLVSENFSTGKIPHDNNAMQLTLLGVDAADTIIFIDHPLWIHYWWAIKRQWMCLFRDRPDFVEGCPMLPKTWALVRMIWHIHKQLRPILLTLIAHHRNDKQIFHIRSPKALAHFRSVRCTIK